MQRLFSLTFLDPSLLRDIDSSLKREGTHTMADVEMALQSGDAQLWLSDDGLGAAVTEINTYPSGLKRAVIWLSAGRLESVVSMDEGFAELARNLGCSEVRLYGRPGWGKALRENGWATDSIIATKRL